MRSANCTLPHLQWDKSSEEIFTLHSWGLRYASNIYIRFHCLEQFSAKKLSHGTCIIEYECFMFSMIDSSVHVIMINDFYLHMYFIDKTFNRPFSAWCHVLHEDDILCVCCRLQSMGFRSCWVLTTSPVEVVLIVTWNMH